MAALTYAQSGVNIVAADQLVDKIKVLVKSTLNSRVKGSVGGYASLFALDSKRWLAASTDGVGTKLKLAFELGIHNTVGIDLVAMSVNDLICVGAEPLFFLDYLATGKLEPETAGQVLTGIVEGCKQAKSALVGGETAEMPGFYADGEYDLAGFAVGFVESSRVLPQKTLRAGDVLIGIGSSGFHSNGYSLLRKLLPAGPAGKEMAKKLLTPTKIYVKSVLPLVQKKKIKALAHITGSGFLNIPRMSEKFSYEIAMPNESELPDVFGWVRRQSGLSWTELFQTFNMGIGMVVAVRAQDEKAVKKALQKSGEKVWTLGHVVRKRPKKGCEVLVQAADGERITLTY